MSVNTDKLIRFYWGKMPLQRFSEFEYVQEKGYHISAYEQATLTVALVKILTVSAPADNPNTILGLTFQVMSTYPHQRVFLQNIELVEGDQVSMKLEYSGIFRGEFIVRSAQLTESAEE